MHSIHHFMPPSLFGRGAGGEVNLSISVSESILFLLTEGEWSNQALIKQEMEAISDSDATVQLSVASD